MTQQSAVNLILGIRSLSNVTGLSVVTLDEFRGSDRERR